MRNTKIAFGRRAGAEYEPSVSISFLCSASNSAGFVLPQPLPAAARKRPLGLAFGAVASRGYWVLLCLSHTHTHT